MGKILTIWSPASSTGVTTLSILLANKISKEKSVCLIDLNLNNSDIYLYLNVNDIEHNIDTIFPYIEGNSFSEEVFKSNLIKINNFMLLQGTKKLDKGPIFTIEQLSPIIDMAKQLFDVVIIDTNSALDNAGTFLALKKADKVAMVINQNIYHFKKFLDKMQITSELLPNLITIVNKFDKNIMLSVSDIKENINTDVYPVEYVENSSVYNGINTQTSIFDLYVTKKSKSYDDNLNDITNKILLDFEYKKSEDIEKKKKGFFKK